MILVNASSSGGLNTLFDDIFDLLPQDEIVSLFFDKLETSTEFSILVEKLGSEEFDQIVDSLKVELFFCFYFLNKFKFPYFEYRTHERLMQFFFFFFRNQKKYKEY